MIYAHGESSAESDREKFAVLVRGDHEVSEYKIRKRFPGAALASRELIDRSSSAFGFSGPLGMDPVILLVDEDVMAMDKMIVGSNKKDHHYVGVTPGDILHEAKDRMEVGDFCGGEFFEFGLVGFEAFGTEGDADGDAEEVGVVEFDAGG